MNPRTPAPVWRSAALLLLSAGLSCAGGSGRECDDTTCPSGCCDGNGVCQSGAAAAACGANGTRCKVCSNGCLDGFCAEGGAGGSGGSTRGGGGAACSSSSYSVQGTLPTPTATIQLAYDSATAIEISHKRDVDPVEDGCVARIDLTLQAKGQCQLHLVAGDRKLPSGALVITSLELVANSQCPGFLDAQEGTYENTGGLNVAEALLSSPTVPGKDTALSCLSTRITLKLSGTLNRKTDNAVLQLPSGEIDVNGSFLSSGDVALHCPQPCSTANCLPHAYWVDPATGLKWENPMKFEWGAWAQARNYCAALTTGGVAAGTWRLPSIDELRTLVRNNPKGQTGGTCPVCANCATPCLKTSCANYDRCSGGGGSSTCGFFEPALGPDCSTPFEIWSNSPVEDEPGTYWSISFGSASIWYVGSQGGARCVW